MNRTWGRRMVAAIEETQARMALGIGVAGRFTGVQRDFRGGDADALRSPCHAMTTRFGSKRPCLKALRGEIKAATREAAPWAGESSASHGPRYQQSCLMIE
jgi:hypothetical protein